MATIQYFDGNKHIYVEVSENIANALQELDSEELRIKRKESRRQVASLEQLLDEGLDFEESSNDRLTDEQIAKVRDAIEYLTPDQQWLINQVFYENRTQAEIARELGVSKAAITQRLERIFEKMKKVLS